MGDFHPFSDVVVASIWSIDDANRPLVVAPSALGDVEERDVRMSSH
jgi:hypothetical protein